MFRGLVPYGQGPRDIEKMFDRMFHDFYDTFGLSIFSADMKADIRENDKEYIVEAEIPGVNKEQIHIDYHNDYLTVAVENVQELNEERENYIRKERKMGRTSRTFYIENVQEDGIKAKYENGILKIVLPKDTRTKAKRRRIEIQ